MTRAPIDFDARLFHGIENGAGIAAIGLIFGMHRHIMVGEAQREGIGESARDCYFAFGQIEAELRELGTVALEGGGFAAKGDVQLGLVRYGFHRERERALERSSRAFTILRHSDHTCDGSGDGHMGSRFRQLFAETALIEFRNQTAFELIAFVEKGEAKCEADVFEISVFWAQVITVRGLMTVDRSPAMKALRVRSATRTILAIILRPLVIAIALAFGKNDGAFLGMGQIVERGDDGPAVELCLIDLLGSVIEAGRVAEADRIGGGEQPEGGMRTNDPVLIEKREAAGGFRTRWMTNITSGRPASYSSKPGLSYADSTREECPREIR